MTSGWDNDCHVSIPPVHVEDDDTPATLVCASVAVLAILVMVFVWAGRRRS